MKRWSTLLHRYYCLKYGGTISWQDQWITLNDIISESIHTIFTLRCKKVDWEGIRRHEGMIFPINFTDKGPFVIDIIRGLKTNKNHIRIRHRACILSLSEVTGFVALFTTDVVWCLLVVVSSWPIFILSSFTTRLHLMKSFKCLFGSMLQQMLRISKFSKCTMHIEV